MKYYYYVIVCFFLFLFSWGLIFAQEPPDSTKISLDLESEPDSVNIIIPNTADTVVTPTSVIVKSGVLSFEAFKSGYDSLIHEIELESGRSAILRFLLRTNKPIPITAEQLGLEYREELPLREEEEVSAYRQKFINISEMFLITPFSQGLLAKIILGNDDDGSADVLLISGAALTLGTYILGKILSSKRLKDIREYNNFANDENLAVKGYNQEIENKIKAINREKSQTWQEENKNKGTVIVTYK